MFAHEAASQLIDIAKTVVAVRPYSLRADSSVTARNTNLKPEYFAHVAASWPTDIVQGARGSMYTTVRNDTGHQASDFGGKDDIVLVHETITLLIQMCDLSQAIDYRQQASVRDGFKQKTSDRMIGLGARSCQRASRALSPCATCIAHVRPCTQPFITTPITQPVA